MFSFLPYFNEWVVVCVCVLPHREALFCKQKFLRLSSMMLELAQENQPSPRQMVSSGLAQHS